MCAATAPPWKMLLIVHAQNVAIVVAAAVDAAAAADVAAAVISAVVVARRFAHCPAQRIHTHTHSFVHNI